VSRVALERPPDGGAAGFRQRMEGAKEQYQRIAQALPTDPSQTKRLKADEHPLHRGQGIGDLVEDKIKSQEKYCTHCRGLHDPYKVNDPMWRPYTPTARLDNLGVSETIFTGLYSAGRLPVSLKDSTMDVTTVTTMQSNRGRDLHPGEVLNHRHHLARTDRYQKQHNNSDASSNDDGTGQAVFWENGNLRHVTAEHIGKGLRWAPTFDPVAVNENEFKNLFHVLWDGTREQHESYRYLATRALEVMVVVGADRGLLHLGLQEAVPSIRFALSTYEIRYIGLQIYLLHHVLDQHTRVLNENTSKTKSNGGGAPRGDEILQVMYKILPKLCPILQLYFMDRRRIKVPPAGCLPFAGSETGRGEPMDYGHR